MMGPGRVSEGDTTLFSGLLQYAGADGCMVSHDLLPEMARIPAGAFRMGTDEGDEDERPVHRLDLDEFHISVHEVTNEDYARFVGQTGHRVPAVYEIPLVVAHGGRNRERAFRQISASYAWHDGQPSPDRLSHPVTLVCWQDAVAYCDWLVHLTRKPIRLPTEAEWEKAASGGIDCRRYPFGDEIDPSAANFLPDPSLKRLHSTRPVGSYPPNSYGLYDMAGNVWEWVSDWYDPGYYASSPVRNPQGPPEGRLRLVRGGAWLDADVRLLRCGHRHKVPDDTYSYSIGFRLAY